MVFANTLELLQSLRAPTVPTGDYVPWLAASVVWYSFLFVVLPAGPWIRRADPSEAASSKRAKPLDAWAQSVQIKNGHVSTVHAITACLAIGGWLAYFQSYDNWSYRRNMQGGVVSTPAHNTGDEWLAMIICNTLGYFIYDIICMAYYHKLLGSVGSYIHHAAIGGALALGLLTGVGRMYHAFYVFEEFSTPFLNTKNLYPSSSRKYKTWAILFAASFFLCRGFVGLPFSVPTYWCLFTYWFEVHGEGHKAGLLMDACVFLQLFSFSVSRLLNIYWMSLIAKKIFCDKPKKKTIKVDGAQEQLPEASPTAQIHNVKKLQ